MKKFFVLIILCSVFVIFTGVGPIMAQTKAPYKIGGIFPLTGYLSWLGEYKKKGSELKVELINKAGGINGRQLELVVYDDQSSPETGSRVAQRLVSKDGVIAMIGTASVPISGAVASIGNRYKIPTIIGSGYEVDSKKDHFVFNSAHKTDFAVERPFEYFKGKGITKVALLMPIGPLGELGGGLARKYAPKYGITIVGEERFDVKAPDITAQLAKLRTLGPQAVFSFCTGEPAALVARSMAQLGMNIHVLVSNGNANNGFLKLVSNVNIPILVPAGRLQRRSRFLTTTHARELILDFNKAHQQKFGEPANYYSAEMVDAVDIIAAALKLSRLRTVKNFRMPLKRQKGWLV